ncbi:ATPase [bacterium (Candidatus Blackallbacteria) CG17_big_fil_post_rev_8_21_14_2_50_48_46]|uniref:ATPase n=1 Tax=bacterium (Candidatus Blackallbacteria) CG17_big_fil_post_rev_8_21_14_2_50_48_46 TaxID=2014261 RepID=A0A2M7GAN4_9BACT|nr:MAG: ATPase [bacterium (Candidatus Blackallbacteria) CG18_big_fil_WC_8_21_14_2_50_49_26]PIW19214.1 MAG: ATPase [bacterium (Candidatus Blackallbacteria) CG17_big_fil_post_rev_8_21_14_2_50_48_46]PIW45436.1 MAG: ATPase [bacterium (Candidatus Blackallbacteria) CG13_big_fil_rev_8_21_14_2_50_49_14]
MKLHSLPAPEVLKRLDTQADGLSETTAHRRFEEFGPNKIANRPRKNWLQAYFRQYLQFFALLLEVASVLAFIANFYEPGQGNDVLAWAILGAVFVNASFSFWQEFKADRAMEALLRLMPAFNRVIRGGRQQKIDASLIVPGDILLLEEGDAIPADAILIEAHDLRINMSTLNGESMPANRVSEPDPCARELEARNIVFAGTSVVSGNGRAVVFATGAATEFGKIATLTRDVKKNISPMQREIIDITRILTSIAFAMGILFLILGLLSGKGWLTAAIFALSLIVANVPEGLLPTITLSLSMASQRMAKRNALVKNLDSVETLGSATVICTDKTGTLTRNEMTVRHIWLSSGELINLSGEGYFQAGTWDSQAVTADTLVRLEDLIRAAVLNSHARIEAQTALGDPTELALVAASKKIPHSLAGFTRVGEIPFTSERRMMSTEVEFQDKKILLSKGAPEVILNLCSHQMVEGGQCLPLEPADRENMIQAAERFESQAFRVLALAKAEGTEEKNLCLLGLVAIMDLPRPEVAGAIQNCYTAGIRILMITGDHPRTAEAVARKIGLRVDRVMTGSELRVLPEEELARILKSQDILFARMESSQKLLIASVLQNNGEIVAMTGDGVNDAPALRKADIGIAMGKAGTDVTKEAADMILLDDNFRSIVAAIEEGRTVYFNIKKFVTYHLTSNIPEILPYVFSFFFKIPLPLSVIQILSIDLASDLIPGIALGSEPPEANIMKRPPVNRHEKILDWEVFKRGYLMNGMVEISASMFGFIGFLMLHGWVYGDLSINNSILHKQAMTMTLLGAVTCQIFNALSLRSYEFSAWSVGFFSNPYLLGALSFDLVWIWMLLNLKPIQFVFNTAYIPWQDLWLLLPFPILLFALHESYKAWLRKKNRILQRG